MAEEKKQEEKEKKEEPEVARVDPIHFEDSRVGKKKHLLSCDRTE